MLNSPHPRPAESPMLCFLPPIPNAPKPDPEPGRSPRISDAGVFVIILLVMICAVLAPFGW